MILGSRQGAAEKEKDLRRENRQPISECRRPASVVRRQWEESKSGRRACQALYYNDASCVNSQRMVPPKIPVAI